MHTEKWRIRLVGLLLAAMVNDQHFLSATCSWGYQCESNPINKSPRVLPPTSEVYLGKVANKTILLRMLSSLLWHAIIDVVK